MNKSSNYPKKVVLAIFTLQGNGAERVVQTLARSISSKGHEAHIVVFKDDIDFRTDAEIKIHFFPYKFYRILPRWLRREVASRAFDRFIARTIGHVDLVLSNLYPVDFVLSKSRLPNKYFVMHNTMSSEYNIDDLAGKTVQNLSSVYSGKQCICVSEGVKIDMKKLFGGNIEAQKIYNPIDPRNSELLATEEGPAIKDYLIHVGKFKKAKRHDRLLRAYALSKVKIPLVLLGTGPLQRDAEVLADQLGIGDKVHFVGYQENPFPWIQAARLMVVSSDFEGLGMNILEALSLHVPCISTNCPSGPAEILPSKNLVETSDETALANLIRSASEAPDEFRVNLPEKFDASKVADQYLQLAN